MCARYVLVWWRVMWLPMGCGVAMCCVEAPSVVALQNGSGLAAGAALTCAFVGSYDYVMSLAGRVLRALGHSPITRPVTLPRHIIIH